MNEGANKAVVRRYFEEVWNKGNVDVAPELIDENFSVEGCGGAISGLEAVKLYVSSYRSLFPDVHFTILSMQEEGDKVVACWLGRGLQLMCDCQDESAPPKTGQLAGLSVYRIADGKIAEAWADSDRVTQGAAPRLGINRNTHD